MNIVIPMAGEGSRFKVNGYELPKPLILVDDKPMIEYAVKSLNIDGNYIYIVRKYENEYNNKLLRDTLERITPKCTILEVNYLTNGSAETCLIAKDFIDNDDELIITNCDQLMEWDSSKFLEFTKSKEIDGAIVTYESTHPKNSFADVDKYGIVKTITEKDPISDKALVGLHYWKMGKDFIYSTQKMIKKNVRFNNEFYVAPTYNEMIQDGKIISNFHLENNQYISLGNPDDLNLFLGRKKEYNKNKIKTILCDLDGTILKHTHRFSKLSENQEILEGVNKKFDEWDSLGYKIILLTARKESARFMTEKLLSNLKIPYDTLLMGVGSGVRVLINDKLTEPSFDRALSINVITDNGFNKVDWKKYDL